MLFKTPIDLDLKDANVRYYPNFFDTPNANRYFKNLLKHIKWQQDYITLYGKTHKQPRLTAFYANNKNSYKYSNITMQPHIFNGDLLDIKSQVEATVNTKFTSCLANLYRDGNDSNGWHADNEKALGKNPVIASLSFGAERFFHLKHKTNKTLKTKFILEHGSLLIMQGETQTHWLHQIPKTKKKIESRINLTFRIIV